MNVIAHLRKLEVNLLLPHVRRDAELVSALLAEEFREFGSSGCVFTKSGVMATLQQEPGGERTLHDFEGSLLSQDVALVTYRTLKAGPGALTTESLHSSLWIQRDGRWQMLFHQGTPITPAFTATTDRPQSSS